MSEKQLPQWGEGVDESDVSAHGDTRMISVA